MLKRIITAVVALAIFVPVCIFSDTVVFAVAMAALSCVGVFEMCKCVGAEKDIPLGAPLYAVAAGAPVASFFLDKTDALCLMFGALFAVLAYFLALGVFRANDMDFEKKSAVFSGGTYVIVSFAALELLRVSDGGEYLYLLPFVGAWVSDTFAYFTGRLLGRHKLIPRVSPKKTVEGAVGGIIFAAGAYVLYGFIVGKMFGVEPQYVALAVSGAVIAVISQIGDLVMSAIKRKYGIKDYGFIFPGHGGVLDRFDSVILCSPVLFVLCDYIEFFTLFR